MKKSLVALAAAGLLGTGVAPAANAGDQDVSSLAQRVQYVQYEDRTYGPPRDGFARDDARQLQVDDRQQRLLNRIERNYQNGRLSRQEWRALRRDLADIEARQQSFEADGRLGPRETALLQDDLDRLNNRLREMRLDDW